MIGNKYSNWTVVKHVVGKFYECQCNCGELRVKHMSHLLSKTTVGCSKCMGIRTHGLSKHPSYASWDNMMQKCSNPKTFGYARIGAKGIKVVERWRKVESFIEDMGERPFRNVLARIDMMGDFGPDNCLWLSREDNIKHIVAHRDLLRDVSIKKKGSASVADQIQDIREVASSLDLDSIKILCGLRDTALKNGKIWQDQAKHLHSMVLAWESMSSNNLPEKG